MVLFQPEDLYAAGQQGGDLAKGLASDIARNVCGLYERFPRGFGIADPTGGATSALASGVMDSFCGRVPGANLPAAPSSGDVVGSGACCSAEYDFTVTFNAGRFVGGVCGALEFTGLTTTFRGTGKVVDVRGSEDGRVIQYVREDCQGNIIVGDVTQRDEFCRVPTGYTFTVAPGFENACAPGDGSYPPGLPPSSNPGNYPYAGNDGIQRDIPYSIDFPDGGGFPSINFPDMPDINIPVTIKPTGIEIDIDVNGGGSGGTGGISPDDLQTLLDAAGKVPGIQEGIDDLTNGGNQSSENIGEKTGEQEGTVPGISGLIVQITGFPAGTGRKFGQPQIFDFGRAHFKRGDFYTPEIPIATIRQWVSAPVDADGYAVYLKPGVKANITVVKQVKENGG